MKHQSKIYRYIIKNKSVLLLISIFIFHFIFNFLWLEQGYAPLSDEAYYLLHSVRIYKAFPQNFLATALSISPTRPTLVPLTTLPFYLLFGPSLFSSVLTQSVYLAILIFSTYGIGEKIYSETLGLLSAFAVSMFPAIFSFSRLFYVDFGLTAMISLSIYALILTDFFKKRKYSLLFGISLGLAALTKSSFIIFLFGPLFFIFIKLIRKIKKNKEQFINFSIAISLGIFIGSILYLPNFWSILESNVKGRENIKTWILVWDLKDNEGPKVSSSDRNYLFNLSTYYFYIFLLSKEISMPFFLFFLFSLVIILTDLIRKKINKNLLLVMASLVFSFLFLTIIPVKFIRPSIPILPIVAILLVYPVFKFKKLKNFLIILLILVGLTTFFIDWNSPTLLEGRSYDTLFKLKESDIEKIIEIIPKSEKESMIGIFNIQLSPTIQYYAEIKNINFTTAVVYETDKPVYETVMKMNYLIIDNFWDEGAKMEGRLNETQVVVDMFKNESSTIYDYFKQIGEVNTSSGLIKIYKNISKKVF